MKKLPIIVGGILLVLALVLGVIVYQKSQVKVSSTKKEPEQSAVRKIDLSTQPEWVQKLQANATKGRSANGLQNATIKITGIPKDLIDSVNYVIQYQTSNKGSQGALSTKPIEIDGGTEFNKTIDFGTCSTKSCVIHEGVTSIEIELDFTGILGDSFLWSQTVDLK